MSKEEIKDLFEYYATKNAMYDSKLETILFDRDEVLNNVYECIAYSKYYSAQKERQRELLEILKEISDEEAERWQEEIYKRYEERIKECEAKQDFSECEDCEFLHCCKSRHVPARGCSGRARANS